VILDELTRIYTSQLPQQPPQLQQEEKKFVLLRLIMELCDISVAEAMQYLQQQQNNNQYLPRLNIINYNNPRRCCSIQ